jgi:hypothetical protein
MFGYRAGVGYLSPSVMELNAMIFTVSSPTESALSL